MQDMEMEMECAVSCGRPRTPSTTAYRCAASWLIPARLTDSQVDLKIRTETRSSLCFQH
jgi:hypothetical protein